MKIYHIIAPHIDEKAVYLLKMSCSPVSLCCGLAYIRAVLTTFEKVQLALMQPRSTSPPLKRPRRAPSPAHSDSNGRDFSNEGPSLPPLSLSILGLEPLDEFIKEIADFVHHMIMTRPDQIQGKVEVEAKIGILHDRMTGKRLALPVLVETSICCFPIRSL